LTFFVNPVILNKIEKLGGKMMEEKKKYCDPDDKCNLPDGHTNHSKCIHFDDGKCTK
jgi:hypothetical protein